MMTSTFSNLPLPRVHSLLRDLAGTSSYSDSVRTLAEVTASCALTGAELLRRGLRAQAEEFLADMDATCDQGLENLEVDLCD